MSVWALALAVKAVVSVVLGFFLSLPLVEEDDDDDDELAAASVNSFWKRSSCKVFFSVKNVDRSEATPSGEEGDRDLLTAHGRDTA